MQMQIWKYSGQKFNWQLLAIGSTAFIFWLVLLHITTPHYTVLAPTHTTEQTITLTSKALQQIKAHPVLSFKSATVNRSLPSAALHAGITQKMLAQLQSIFKNTINFRRNMHHGDRISFLYKNGAIVAAELTSRGKTYRAVRYQDPQRHHIAYFTPDGHGLESRFLSAPLHYKRISSLFNFHRLDPVLHQVRPHLGIDYAAASGTPIQSIGDGHVIFLGQERGFGRVVKIRYDRHDVALYAHLQHFAHSLKLRQWIHKGEVIGYVGESGWATAPHLHFGFYVDGKPRNWLAMKVLSGNPIPLSYRKQFLATSKQLFTQLHWYQDMQLAMDNTNTKNKSPKI